MTTITTWANRGTEPAADAAPENSSPAVAAITAGTRARVLLIMHASCAVASSCREREREEQCARERQGASAQAHKSARTWRGCPGQAGLGRVRAQAMGTGR